MKSRKLWTAVLYTILFVALFIVLQVIALVITDLTVSFINGTPFLTTMNGAKDGTSIALSSVISSLLTLLLFTRTKWAQVSNLYLKSRPWGVLLWAALLALGSILPMEFIAEKINLTMPEQTEAMFQSIMETSWGYIALGIMAPLEEEVVFRGGVLRVLLNATGSKSHWIAIILSALVFGFITSICAGNPRLLARFGTWMDVLSYKEHSTRAYVALDEQHSSLCDVPFNATDERRKAH